jgi:urease accessory protein UreF
MRHRGKQIVTDDIRWLEERIAGLRELIEARYDQVAQRFDSLDTAVQLQAKEYERRLNDLNNEGSRLAQAVASNVSNDTWVGFLARFNEWQETVNKALTHGLSSESLQTGRRAGVSSAFAAIIAVVTIAMPIIGLIVYLTVRK